MAGEAADTDDDGLTLAIDDEVGTGEPDEEAFEPDVVALVRSWVSTPLPEDEHPAISVAIRAMAAQILPAVPGRESLWSLWVAGGEAASTDEHSLHDDP